jgi:hypothetical protein
MPRKPTLSPFAARLDALGVSPAEAAQIARLPLEDVEAMVDGGPVADVPFRWLEDDADAARRVDQLRRTSARSLRGEGATQAKVTVPYGTSDVDKVTGGVPS